MYPAMRGRSNLNVKVGNLDSSETRSLGGSNVRVNKQPVTKMNTRSSVDSFDMSTVKKRDPHLRSHMLMETATASHNTSHKDSTPLLASNVPRIMRRSLEDSDDSPHGKRARFES